MCESRCEQQRRWREGCSNSFSFWGTSVLAADLPQQLRRRDLRAERLVTSFRTSCGVSWQPSTWSSLRPEGREVLELLEALFRDLLVVDQAQGGEARQAPQRAQDLVIAMVQDKVPQVRAALPPGLAGMLRVPPRQCLQSVVHALPAGRPGPYHTESRASMRQLGRPPSVHQSGCPNVLP